MFVGKANFAEAVNELALEKVLALDTETYGLWHWKTPHFNYKPGVFSVQFSSAGKDYYFDFLNELGDEHFWILQRNLFDNPEMLWFIQNAKFDMHQLANHGCFFAGKVHCTKAIARVINNLEPSLKLDDLAKKYLGAEKLDVMTVIEEQKLYTEVKKFGKNDKKEKLLHFDRLPLEMLVKYGERDTRLCFELGQFQLRAIEKTDTEILANFQAKLKPVYENECELTKTLFDMEREGIKIDRAYTEKTYEHEIREYEKLEASVQNFAISKIGKKVDLLSAPSLKELFAALGEQFTYTEKGNISFDADALQASPQPIAKEILQYRYHYKRAHTYFENFLWLADVNDVLHCDFQQSGTETGRMSCWNPNLQNIPKRSEKQETNFPTRRCFIPKTPDEIFVSLDYDQVEYRMMLDYAAEKALIEKVQAGMDIHDATKEELNLKDRDEAKTMNFGLLYGMGIAKLGIKLNCSFSEAKAKRENYFRKLPGVKRLIFAVRDVAEKRGYIFNWLGRVLVYTRENCFKSPNGMIQGGCGDLAKVSMNKSHKRLQGKKSKLLIQVHDELLFSIHKTELGLIPELQNDMSNTYPSKSLQLTAGVAWSANSWKDLQEGTPEPTI